MNSCRHFDTVAITILIVASILVGGRLTFSQSQQIGNGINYLKSTQSADGSWGGTPTSLNGVFPTTAAALEALRTVETTISPNQTSAIQFLTSQAVEENPFLAARVVALVGTSSNTTGDANALLGRQNLDGGWGTAEGFESNTLDTSLALLALKAANVTNNTVLINAVNYLTIRQNSDNGWALVPGEDSQVFYTAIALQALNSCRLQFAVSLSQPLLSTPSGFSNTTDGSHLASPSTCTGKFTFR